jgi:hypothetical protein
MKKRKNAMTNFTDANILKDGEYVYYAPQGIMTPWNERKFIARFKHRGPVTKAKFLKVLKKYYTVEDYFAKMEAGSAPTQIFMNDGYLTFHRGEDRNYFILDGKII